MREKRVTKDVVKRHISQMIAARNATQEVQVANAIVNAEKYMVNPKSVGATVFVFGLIETYSAAVPLCVFVWVSMKLRSAVVERRTRFAEPGGCCVESTCLS